MDRTYLGMKMEVSTRELDRTPTMMAVQENPIMEKTQRRCAARLSSLHHSLLPLWQAPHDVGGPSLKDTPG